MSEGETPLTDAVEAELGDPEVGCDYFHRYRRMRSAARTLERQLAEARLEAATSADFITTLRCELAEARTALGNTPDQPR